MRWSDLDISYARPLCWITALLGKHVVPFTVGNLHSGRSSEGHRQLCRQTFNIATAQDYVQRLKEHQVMVDVKERQQSISEQLDTLEKSLQGHIVARDEVLEEVVDLVEWPTVTHANFAESFLKVPKEVLISEMVEHQKYFPIANDDGSLKNTFVITADTTPNEAIRQGNVKVLSARLADGAFLYEQDLKVPLQTFNEKLKEVTFQKELGSVFDKVKRLQAHVKALHQYFPDSDLAKVQRAALLCKADLASDMVYEFPDLQGVMGSHYALAHGEDNDVAQAIDEHWMPRGENAPLPKSLTGTILSLAEKFDNIISCFGTNRKPTSSSDPYALRRQMLGIIKMLITGQHHLPFQKTLRQCFEHFPPTIKEHQEQVLTDIEAFTVNRIKTVFQDYDLSKDEVEASISGGFSDIYDAFRKVKALHDFRQQSQEQFTSLLEVYKRAKGQTEGYANQSFSPKLLEEKAEKALANVLNSIHQDFEAAINNHNYDHAYSLIAKMQQPLATLFDEVHILAKDPTLRNNRIALLQQVFALFDKLVDFEKIQQKTL